MTLIKLAPLIGHLIFGSFMIFGLVTSTKVKTTPTILRNESYLPNYDTLDLMSKLGKLGGGMWL
jgi:hypothetical protein